MRIRNIAAAAALLALALVMTGCTRNAPEITDAQVEEWRDLAAETIPAATEITIDVRQNATMAGQSTSIDLTVSFAGFADLAASEQAIVDFAKSVTNQARGATVSTTAVNDGAESHGAEVSKAFVATIPGLASATVVERPYEATGDMVAPMLATVRLYLDDTSVVDPEWLDLVASTAQTALSEVNGHVFAISILPASAAGIEPSDPEFAKKLIQVGDLAAFKAFGVDNGCVRTDAWAYDVSGVYVAPYPGSEPGGACA